MRYFALLAAMIAMPAMAATPAIKDSSYKDADGNRVLAESVVVNASLADVWKAFTTDEGMARWAVPVVHVTPGNGGLIEFAFDPKGKIGDPQNVRNRIDIYLPDKLLAFHNEFIPAGGPMDPATFGKLRTIMEFAPAGADRTQVTETVVGFGQTPEFDALYTHLRGGNAEYLATLAGSFSGASGNQAAK